MPFLSGTLPQCARAESSADSAVRGVVMAEAAATISSDLNARISSIPFRMGEHFQKGDVLLRFDCSRYQAELRATEAEVKTQAINLATQRQLMQHNATGASDLALAEAKHAQAIATADAQRIRIGQCTIDAPYDGRVVERLVDVFEMPQANAPLMKIVKTGALEINLIVPSSWAVWLKPGDTFSFRIDETAESYQVRLISLGAVVDPVSRTMKLVTSLVDAGPLVRPGMSGSAEIIAPPAGQPVARARR
jgi:RND family efflux transporter MFP subunit